MKLLTTTLLVLLTLCAVTSHAQPKKTARPSQFTHLPSTIEFSETQLGRLFIAAKGQRISMALPGNLLLAGPVTSRLAKYSNLQTVVIQLPAFNNTLFSISRQTGKDHVTYVGRMFNPDYADGYELRQTSGKYQLVKIDIEKILNNCSQ